MEDDDFSVFGGLDPESYAVMQRDSSPLSGASLYDNAAQSIRAARLGPMAAQAGGAYAQQAGGLQSLLRSHNLGSSGRHYAEGGVVDGEDDGSAPPYLMASRRAANLADLERRYAEGAPSDSEKWLSVAAALLSPTQTGKTTESLANALGVFGQYSGEERKYRRAKADAIADMTAKYDLAEGNLAARMAAAQLAAQKARMPRTALDPTTGKPVLIPAASEVAQPMTEEEYNALAPGTPYMVPTGEHAGQIVYKGAS